ncbi:peptidase [Streptomyces sp. Act143]|uniref:S8 family serine peptidase n=1 Tax=Streptomyces sp. Act143 TaxID=2200760 RepID=UPI000D67E9BE|nr:S8 family serine peptidase [Streptomyces sp. Act143]PWI13059.1 peptidase [Streptomyces sp. Act143]
MRARTHRPQAAGAASAVAAALLVAVGAAPAAAESVELPAVRTSLGSDEPCATASTQRVQTEPWALASLGASRALTLSAGAGTTVAVVDTGVSEKAPGLTGRVTALGDAGTDCVGHGTFAAGLIAAAPEAGGAAGPAGLAPRARILAVRGTDERGGVTAQRLADAIREAADEGAAVIYVGGALADGKAVLSAAVAYASEKDALVVAPLAPDALTKDRSGQPVTPEPWYWPAAAPGVLAVTDFGPDGKRPDNAPVVSGADLAAPGDGVVGIGPAGKGHYIGSGASLAAAHVAGAAAQVRARYPELSAAEVSRRLTEAAYPAAPPRLDPYAALSAVLPDSPGTPPRPAAAVVPAAAATGPRNRALVVAAGSAAVVALVAAAAVVIPRGRARGWRAAGS